MNKYIYLALVVSLLAFGQQSAQANYPCQFINSTWTGNCEGCQNVPAAECQTKCTPRWGGYDCSQYLQRAQVPLCTSPVSGSAFAQVSYPCKCSNGNTVTNKSEYAACYQFVTCWDGSLAPTYNYCPRVTSGCYLNQYTGDTSCMNNQINPSQSISGSSYYFPTYSYSTYGYSTYHYPNNSNYGYYDTNMYSSYNYDYNTTSNYGWGYQNGEYYYR